MQTAAALPSSPPAAGAWGPGAADAPQLPTSLQLLAARKSCLGEEPSSGAGRALGSSTHRGRAQEPRLEQISPGRCGEPWTFHRPCAACPGGWAHGQGGPWRCWAARGQGPLARLAGRAVLGLPAVWRWCNSTPGPLGRTPAKGSKESRHQGRRPASTSPSPPALSLLTAFRGSLAAAPHWHRSQELPQRRKY